MIYVALVRGINVGGNRKVEMVRLKASFESLGFTDVKTYINSGNAIFKNNDKRLVNLAEIIEGRIEKDFGFVVGVVVRDLENIRLVAQATPDSWVNDADMKTDVMFLWDDVDNAKILDQVIVKSGIDEVIYAKGALLWRVDRANINKSGMLKLVGTDLYKKMTVRNVNTLRRLKILMENL